METRVLIAYTLIALLAAAFAFGLYHVFGKTWLRRRKRRRRAGRARERGAEPPPTG